MVGETYGKYELDFTSAQLAYNLQAGFLAIPQKLLLAVDFGEFLNVKDATLPDGGELPRDLRRQVQETQFRAAAHYYVWTNIVVATLLFTDNKRDPLPGQTEDRHQQELKAVFSYRF